MKIFPLIRKLRGIPIFICESVRYHHEPKLCRDDAKIHCQAVHFAELASEINELNQDLEAEGTTQNDFFTSLHHDLGLGSDDIYSIINDIKKTGEHSDIMVKMGLS